jgi:glycosyltransferase involved in cell wall biosynthesis
LIDAANVCVTVTNYNRNYLIDRFGSVAEKFEVITCGVDVGFFKPDSTLPRIPGQILTVGRLAPEKGYGYLLDAAALLHRQGVHYRWLIVGDGPEGHWIEKGIQSRSLEGKVILMGTMPSTEVRRLMASSELFALASIRETAGMVYIEAMATATPVIGTNVLGVSEVVLDSKTGILVAPHDPVALANGIQCLLGSPGLRARLGAQGRKHAVERFSLARQAGKLLSLWEKCGT